MYLLFSDPKTRLRAVSIMVKDQVTSTSKLMLYSPTVGRVAEGTRAVTMLEAEVAVVPSMSHETLKKCDELVTVSEVASGIIEGLTSVV